MNTVHVKQNCSIMFPPLSHATQLKQSY